ncbi:phosphoglycerate mutase-like protein [Atractiella rhizophila]|nr:phosphoglycerate mutase-like protein [Atractiella rhizophila]
MKVTVTILRHGETNENTAGILQGHADTNLNELGLQQAISAGKHFRRVGQKFDFCFSSDLERARKTGELIMEQLSHPKHVQTDPRLRGRHFPGCLPLSLSDPNVGIETLESFKTRLCDFWDYVFPPTFVSTTPLDSAPDLEDVNVLIITHTGTVKRLVISSLVIDREYSAPLQLSHDLKRSVPQVMDGRVGNCSKSVVLMEKSGDGSWCGSVLEYANEEHLEPEYIDLASVDKGCN